MNIALKDLPLDWHQEPDGASWRADGMRVATRDGHNKRYYISLVGGDLMTDKNDRNIRYFGNRLNAMRAANEALPIGEWTEKNPFCHIRSDGAMVRREDDGTLWHAYARASNPLTDELFENAEAAMTAADDIQPCLGIEHDEVRKWQKTNSVERKRPDGARVICIDGIWYGYGPDDKVIKDRDGETIQFAFSSTAMRMVDATNPLTYNTAAVIDAMMAHFSKPLWNNETPTRWKRLDLATVTNPAGDTWFAHLRNGEVLEIGGEAWQFPSSESARRTLDCEHPVSPWKRDSDILWCRFDGASILETDRAWVAYGPKSAAGATLMDGEKPAFFDSPEKAMFAVDLKHPIRPPAEAVTLGEHWMAVHATIFAREDGGCISREGNALWIAYRPLADDHNPPAYGFSEEGPFISDEAEPLMAGDMPAIFKTPEEAMAALDEQHPYKPLLMPELERWTKINSDIIMRLDGVAVSFDQNRGHWVIYGSFEAEGSLVNSTPLENDDGEVYVFDTPAEAMEAADELLKFDEDIADDMPDLVTLAGARSSIMDDGEQDLFMFKVGADGNPVMTVGVSSTHSQTIGGAGVPPSGNHLEDPIPSPFAEAGSSSDLDDEETIYKKPAFYQWLWPPTETFLADPPDSELRSLWDIVNIERVTLEDGWSRARTVIYGQQITSETHYLTVRTKGPLNPGKTVRIDRTQPIIFRHWIWQSARWLAEKTGAKSLGWQWPHWWLSWLTGSTKITLSTPGTEDLH